MIHADRGYADAVGLVEELLQLRNGLIDSKSVQVDLRIWRPWRAHDISDLFGPRRSRTHSFYEPPSKPSKAAAY
jgi:hypothetical protein